MAADLDRAVGARVTRRAMLVGNDEFGGWGVLIRDTDEGDEIVAITNWDRQVCERIRERR